MNQTQTKICNKCGIEKSVNDFYRDKNRYDGRYPWCKQCKREYNIIHPSSPRNLTTEQKQRKIETTKQWIKTHPRKVREYKLQTRYGITSKQYTQMLTDQNNCCAICGRHQSEFKCRLHVDHNRETGKVRGLLCYECNTMLGMAKHSVKHLRKGAEYLDDRDDI